MIEMRCLKNVVIFIEASLCIFCLFVASSYKGKVGIAIPRVIVKGVNNIIRDWSNHPYHIGTVCFN